MKSNILIALFVIVLLLLNVWRSLYNNKKTTTAPQLATAFQIVSDTPDITEKIIELCLVYVDYAKPKLIGTEVNHVYIKDRRLPFFHVVDFLEAKKRVHRAMTKLKLDKDKYNEEWMMQTAKKLLKTSQLLRKSNGYEHNKSLIECQYLSQNSGGSRFCLDSSS